MAAASRSTTADYLNSTLEAWRETRVKSWLDRPVPFIDALMSKGMGEAKQGGDGMRIPVRTTRHSSTIRISTGYEANNLTVFPTLQGARVDWCDVARAVVISGHEERINGGPAALVKLAKDREEDTEYALKMEWQKVLLDGGSAGDLQAWADCETLNGTDFTDGWLEEEAYGSQGNTIEGLSKSTYSALVNWQNQSMDFQNAFGTYGLTQLFAAQTAVEALSMEPDQIEIFGSRGFVQNLKRALQANERYLSEKDLDGGKRIMVFGGRKISTIYSDLPQAGATTATQKWSCIFIDFSCVKWTPIAGFVMKSGPYKELSPFYDSSAKLFQHMGQLNTNSLSSCALGVRGETY